MHVCAAAHAVQSQVMHKGNCKRAALPHTMSLHTHTPTYTGCSAHLEEAGEQKPALAHSRRFHKVEVTELKLLGMECTSVWLGQLAVLLSSRRNLQATWLSLSPTVLLKRLACLNVDKF